MISRLPPPVLPVVGDTTPPITREPDETPRAATGREPPVRHALPPAAAPKTGGTRASARPSRPALGATPGDISGTFLELERAFSGHWQVGEASLAKGVALAKLDLDIAFALARIAPGAFIARLPEAVWREPNVLEKLLSHVAFNIGEKNFQIPTVFGRDVELAVALVERSPKAYQYLPLKMRRHLAVAQAAVKGDYLCFKAVPKPQRDDPAFVAGLLQQGECFGQLSATLKKDKTLARLAITHAAHQHSDLPPELQHDRELAELAVTRQWSYVFKNPTAPWISDRDLARRAIALNPYVIASRKEFADDPELRALAKAAYLNDPRIGDIPFPLRDDRDVVLAALARNRISGVAELHAFPDAVRFDPGVLAAFFTRPSLFCEPAAERDALLAAFGDRMTKAFAMTVAPELFASLPAPLRNDPDVALHAVKRKPTLYADLSDALKRDKRIALIALSRDGQMLQHAPDEVKASRYACAVAVNQNGEAIAYADKALQQELGLALNALSRAPRLIERYADHPDFNRLFLHAVKSGLRGVPKALAARVGADKELLRSVASKENELRPYASFLNYRTPAGDALALAQDALLDDRHFVLAMLRAGAQISDLPARLRDDPDYCETAVRTTPLAIASAPKGWRSNKTRMLEVISRDPGTFRFAAAELRNDRELVTATLARDATLLPYVSAELRADDGFMIDCAHRNPLVLDMLAEPRRAALFRASTALRESYETLQAQLRAFGLEYMSRFHGSWTLLREVLANRSAPAAADPRPVAIFTTPKSDYNGAFSLVDFSRFTQAYRLMYYEVGSRREMIDVFKDATRGGQAAFVSLGGHGHPTCLSFGSGGPGVDANGVKDPGRLTHENAAELLAAGLRECVADDADVVLMSCSTGSGEVTKANLANMVRDVFPQARIYAPRVDTCATYTFDEAGRFRAPNYWDGPAITYVVPARA